MITPFAVAALYVEPKTIYRSFPGVECWDEARDATTYAGPRPIVAHPACGPWGRLASVYGGHEGGPELAIKAVEQVRAYGGVLEHPIASALWAHMGLPRPGEKADKYGGYSITCRQVDWGHPCAKPTILYCVRVPRTAIETPPPRKPTHWIAGSHKAMSRNGTRKGRMPDHVKCATKAMRMNTPPDFARYLLTLALASRTGTEFAREFFS